MWKLFSRKVNKMFWIFSSFSSISSVFDPLIQCIFSPSNWFFCMFCLHRQSNKMKEAHVLTYGSEIRCAETSWIKPTLCTLNNVRQWQWNWPFIILSIANAQLIAEQIYTKWILWLFPINFRHFWIVCVISITFTTKAHHIYEKHSILTLHTIFRKSIVNFVSVGMEQRYLVWLDAI